MDEVGEALEAALLQCRGNRREMHDVTSPAAYFPGDESAANVGFAYKVEVEVEVGLEARFNLSSFATSDAIE